MIPQRPKYLVPDPARVPGELRERRQWVLWRAEWREGKNGKEGKWTKVPYSARTSKKASSTSNGTWSSFEVAWCAYESGGFDGIGYVFVRDDPYCGVDLDRCRNSDSGVMEPWATEVIARLDSYSELSVSGTGVHTILRGQLPGKGRRKGQVEVYDASRFFCFTGHVLDGGREIIEDRQDALLALYASVFGKENQCRRSQSCTSRPSERDDDRLLNRARQAKNGTKFEALYDHGDVSGYGSASEADFALCGMLGFWTGRDIQRVDRLFRASALMREKWDEPRGASTYGAQTVANALSATSRVAPAGGAPPAHPPASLLAEGQAWHGYHGMNDRGNALRLAWFLRDRVRWAGEAVGWILWTGTHWTRGAFVESEVRELVARHMPRLAAAALGDSPDADRGDLRAYVSNCGRTGWRRNALADLRDVSQIRIAPSHLDSDPHLITAKNGTIDLRTCTLRPHRSDDLITHCVDTAYVPDAKAPRFLRFLHEVTGGSTRTVSFLQRAIGLVLVGEGTRRTKAFFYLYGPPDSGKGTLILMLTEILGPSLVGGLSWGALASATSGGPNSELAQLDGKRLATIADSGCNPRWDAETLKKLTGGDHITCSEKHKPARTYYPRTTLIIAANDRPIVQGAGREAILERLHIVPFRQSFSLNDRKIALGRALPAEKGLKDYLLEHEREGIFAWFVKGALLYLQDGLGTCPDVDAERTGWADDDEDYLPAMLADCAVTARDEESPDEIVDRKITAQDLHHVFMRWLSDQGLDEDAVARAVGDVRSVSRAFNKLISTDTRFGDVRKDQKAEVLAAGHPQRARRRRGWSGVTWNVEGHALLAREIR